MTDADVSLIPKSINDKGYTLNLADVQWSSAESTDGEGGIVTHYTATASYTGSSTSRYATGYTVTANYVGEVAKTDCRIVTYTATFGSMEAPVESKAPAADDSNDPDGRNESPLPFNLAELKTPLMIGGVVLVLVVGGTFAIKK